MQPDQLTMFAAAPAAIASLPVWERIPSPIGRMATQYLHRPSGHIVRHCGHPTANFPYYIEAPDGANIFAPNGRGFQRLDLAKQYVEANDHTKGRSFMTITDEQLAAIKNFAKENGRTWKTALHEAWRTGNYAPYENAQVLQTIRNTFGPTWLTAFKLAKGK